jgi:hypothetical protein
MIVSRKMTDVCRFAGGPYESESSMNTFIGNGVNKGTVSLFAMAAMVIAAFTAKFRPALEAEAPEGYEDASGFHLGSPSIKG